MSYIFLSHSSADEIEAVALRQWLLDNGWDDVFLDLDPERGLTAGSAGRRRCGARRIVAKQSYLSSPPPGQKPGGA